MFEFSASPASLATKKIAITAAAVVLGGSLGGYAIHEHNTAKALADKNQQTTSQLNDTKKELTDLTSKVNMLVARADTQPAAAPEAAPAAQPARPSAKRPSAGVHQESRYKKLQAQLDAQGKAIQDTQNALAGTQGDLVNTRTELTGSIAHTHEELVLLQKRGERNYIEFDINKSKDFQHKGPLGLRLKKANVKHQYADMELIVDDRNLSQKHINLYQPSMFYTPDSPQPVEIVINGISKDHIHGYVSAPKYGKAELASMQAANDAASAPAANPDSGIVATAAAQPPARKKLTVTPQ
ncbi:hypothetical protein [Occallatibacter riparius]|uniref:Uncharacterized protein n=1 Tax=Occallatibacter riparius TaxID=1002689 RepID=A0A9J7BVA2_9BACT|nr:hypothetical protein [Occallatibacter riparius]UWZ86552.1 hypothetical protein MOP44_11535 [Occallatibacter riparius]